MFRKNSASLFFRATAANLLISEEHIPRNFPIKMSTNHCALAVEPMWKPKLLAVAAEIEAYLKASDIPEDNVQYQASMMLPKRVYGAIEECGDDWVTLEQRYFWGWDVEHVLQAAWLELDKVRQYNELRIWEIDPEQMRKVYREDFGRGGVNPNKMAYSAHEQMAMADFDKRKKAISQEEIAELKKMDTERMARETAVYKERKTKIQDDMERARGELLKKFLGKRLSVEPDLRRMQPGQIYTGKTTRDIAAELRADAAAHPKKDDGKK